MKRFINLFLTISILLLSLTGCGLEVSNDVVYSQDERMSESDALKELSSLLTKVDVTTVSNPTLDIYSDEVSAADTLADISTYPLVVETRADIVIEIAAATEMSSSSPDDWIVVVANNFNKQKFKVNGKTIGVNIRKITSGEVVTYVLNGDYKPNVFIPSNEAWGLMLESSGIDITKIEDRIAGNTAGILMAKDTYNSFIDKYKDATVANVLTAANNGDLLFAYTNPFTSSTGLNVLTAMLKSFDENDPLSSKASQALLDYQKNSPPVAYTTAVLVNQASKGIIDCMVMEEQAYINKPELKDYVYFPVGIRHDHPVYTFGWNDSDMNDAAKMFTEFCLNDDSQRLASERGFNLHDDYKAQDPGLTGIGYISAQSLWKQNKNGGKPIIAVFICDCSGSMKGEPINTLKTSLINSSTYIGQDNYIGLISYSDDVTINLPIKQFDAKQRAYFSGEVKSLIGSGGTATYDALLVGVNLIEEAMKEVPDATPIIFLLTDGDRNQGYNYNRIEPIIGGLRIPVFPIAYNYSSTKELDNLATLNEATTIKADTDDIVNQLRNLFNVQM